MKIKAAVVRKPREPFVIEEIDLDEPRANDAAGGVVYRYRFSDQLARKN